MKLKSIQTKTFKLIINSKSERRNSKAISIVQRTSIKIYPHINYLINILQIKTQDLNKLPQILSYMKLQIINIKIYSYQFQ
ncbi:unnamed protein product [Paramecium sonneborni]|uniref:Uncharacterized protein n=1 Tax=Paramecium sonneborni TaxID=65129 RepID=A0A8S1MTA2_9CILI|nr:unnamed protein product [Paramecium sonneborni]